MTSSGSDDSGKRILIVDDEDAILEMCARILEKEGHDVSRAGGEIDVLTRLIDANAAGAPFDLLLTDIFIGLDRGPDLARKARQLFPRLAIVFMSSGPQEAHELLKKWPDKSYTLVYKAYLSEELAAALEPHLKARTDAGPIV